ncbi:serine/threonine protein phosphatase PP6 regulatory subunit Ekc1 [Schizosaccharomyces osmophilus]|uniref:Serine/threonine protein phosphatase PP6 regulatory subunit Ekc1 n=1 Tax=Schizosaccharomyces osmophilus TaxID=2545709 RepID=A0AAE9WG31_9SCHI|nr:serine/threonine protein phosphatase PP6 regulatory subunit Ekc1 [Schizosaccharomyces osmophilus]WBW75009.1 serine/threonine protein phosphatase PP6 regulatory subunit Ekc1 [Schizosaccharomyces osmophilus]
MFWRLGQGFGFQSSTAIEAILNKPEEEIDLPELLEENGVLDECKSHNPKLLDYLCKPEILSQLIDFILEVNEEDFTPIEGGFEELEQSRLSFIASEILSSDVWSICDACVENKGLMKKLWSFLDNEGPLNPLQASYFAKVNEHFLDKKTEETVAFIQSIENFVDKILRHAETSAIMDLLLKFISMDRCNTTVGIADWLYSQGLVQSLLRLLDPYVDPDVQSTVADVIKAIIAISANSNEPGVIGPNSLSRELVSRRTITTLTDYMIDSKAPYSSTSLINGVSIVIELIRKNNSDYDVTPVLQMPLDTHPPTTRDPIYLGTMLRLFAEKIPIFQQILMKPSSTPEQAATSFGTIKPLGFERFRICELYAELLHCSNMSLLSDANAEALVMQRDNLRDYLFRHNNCARELSVSDDEDADSSFTDKQASDPMHGQVPQISKDYKDVSPEVGGDSPMEDAEPVANEEYKDVSETSKYIQPDLEETTSNDSYEPIPESVLDKLKKEPVIGDFLKIKFTENYIIPTVLDHFFEYPWNNFLHNVVYDVVQQVLNGPMEKEQNCALAFDMFLRGKITEKIVRGQEMSDKATSEPNGFRPGYMGHLTIIADEVVKFIEHYSHLFSPEVKELIDDEKWQLFVNNTLADTRARDNQLLGGLEPSMVGYLEDMDDGEMLDANNLPEMQFALEQEYSNSSDDDVVEVHRELSNNSSSNEEDADNNEEDPLSREMSRRLSFDSANGAQDNRDHFAQYMSQHISDNPPDEFSSSSDEDDEEDDEVVEWVSRGKDKKYPRSNFFISSSDRDESDSEEDDENDSSDGERELAEDEYSNGLVLNRK